VIGALYGELTGSFEGLAYLMQQKESQFDTPALFAAMVFLTLMGIGLFLTVAGLERVLIPWHHNDRRASMVRRLL
jgi:NitT/TauT family transport system permease protein